MALPDFLICLDCETPTYLFDYEEGEVTEAFCETCGNDELDQFVSDEEFEAIISAG